MRAAILTAGAATEADSRGNEVPMENPFAKRMRKAAQLFCPFCKTKVPPPSRAMKVFTPDGCLAEACACGAVYAVDETGRLGGQALLDAQAVLCDGDLQRAMTLETGKQVDVRSRPLGTQTIQGGGSRFNRTSASARAWVVRRRAVAKLS